MAKKKMSGKAWFLLGMVSLCVVLGLNYGLFHWWGAAPTGFATWGADSLNGIPVGSDSFTQSGQFRLTSGGVNYNGRIVVGNMYYDGDQELGFLQQGNASIALRKLNYHASVLSYLLQTPTDMLPGLTAVQNGYLGTQYTYQYYNFWGLHATEYDVNAYLRGNYLSVPTGYVADLSQNLNLNLGVFIKLDPSLLGVTSFGNETSDEYFNLTSIWAGVLSANARDYQSGLIAAPGTNITGSGFSQTPRDAAATTTSGYSAQSVGAGTDITNWLNTNDPGHVGSHFDVTSVDSVMYQAGAQMLGMSDGDPVALTEGDFNANATINQTQGTNITLGDPNRDYVKAFIPITLRPETTITQTAYTYNSFSIVNSWWYGLSGTALIGQTVSKPTSVTVKNPYVINTVNVSILCAANYSVYPLAAGNMTDVRAPVVNGTNTIWNTALTTVVGDVAGNTAYNIDDFIGFMTGIGGWIIGVIVVFVVAVLVWRFAKPKKGHGHR